MAKMMLAGSLMDKLKATTCIREEQAAAQLWKATKKPSETNKTLWVISQACQELPSDESLSKIFYLAHGCHAALDAPKNATTMDTRIHTFHANFRCYRDHDRLTISWVQMYDDVNIFYDVFSLQPSHHEDCATVDQVTHTEWQRAGFKANSKRLPQIIGRKYTNKYPKNGGIQRFTAVQ